MAKRFFPIFSIMLLLISLAAPGIQPVAAEEKEDKVYKDGEYDITAKALHADKDEASGAASFIDESAKILIDNGQIKLAISIPNNEMAEIKGLQIEGINPVKEETDDSVIYTYVLNNLKEILNAQVQYEVESLGMEHDVPLRFKLEGINEIPVQENEDGSSEEDGSEDGEGAEDDAESEGDEGTGDDAESEDNEDAEEESEDNEESNQDNGDNQSGNDGQPDDNGDNGNVQEGDNSEEDENLGEENGNSEENDQKEYSPDNLADGYYTVNTSYLKTDNDDKSSMGGYLSDQAFISVKGGNPEVTVTIDDSETVTKLEVADQDAIERLVKGNKRHETFKLDKLSSTLDAYVEYQAPFGNQVYEGNADFRIVFDEETINKVKKSDKPSGKISLEFLADGYYTVNASYLKSDSDDESSMGGYLNDEAFISVKDGNPELTVTINDSETVTKLKVADQNAIERLVKGNKRHETFKLDKLLSTINAYVEYQASYAGGLFEGKADFRIVIDEETIRKAKKSDKPSGESVGENPGGALKIAKSGEKVTVNGNDKLNIKDTKVSIEMPTNLPKGTDFTVNVKDKDSSIPKDYKIAGAIVDVKGDLNRKIKDGKYTLTLSYDKNTFKADEVDIYYYDANKSSWIAQNGIVDIKKG